MIKITLYDAVTRIDSARTVAGRGYYWATAYLVDGLLIDTGCAHTAGELAEALENEKISRIINTHSHEDHIGANCLLQERLNVELLAHPLALPVLEKPRERQPLQLYRRVFWGGPAPSIGKPVQDRQIIETEHFSFQVIYTPGHSPDHLCLYEQERGWLFSGDMFVGGRERALSADNDVWQNIESLKRAANLPLSKLFPGCARVRDNPNRDLLNKIEYLEETGNRVLELHRKGWSVGSIARSLFGGPMWIEFVTFGHFSRHSFIRSFLSISNKKRLRTL
ncbi:MAG: MBL fold metallo-hydrolase [Anaerolineales bacterium]|nr:MBL fold metallo-hydrolase [Anaerolineales bacterium]